MTYPVTTALYAALLGLLFAVLSAWVIAGRLRSGVLLADGGDEGMSRRIRAHGNFSEYIPLILLLAALLEGAGQSRGTLHALLAPLLVARVLHPFGMFTPPNSPQQFLLRGASIIVTLVVLLVSAGLLLARMAA